MDCDFIEIGTSNFDTLIQSCDKNAVGISVEPLENYLDDLPDKPNVIKFPAAISDSPGELDMYYVPPEMIDQYCPKHWGLKGCNSLGSPHPTTNRILTGLNLSHLVQTKKVPVLTFGQLIEKFQVQSIKYLKIDTEGHDCIILKSMLKYFESKSLNINSKLWPQEIKFESNILSSKNQIDDIIFQFKQKGYDLKEQTQDDTYLVKRRLTNSKIIRILFLSYDLNDTEKWECGRRLLDLVKQLENVQSDDFQIDIQTIGYQIDVPSTSKIFNDEFGPDLIISQQFANDHAKKLSCSLNIPLIIVVHYNLKEYLDFYSLEEKQANLICCWTEELENQIKNILSVPTLALNSNWLNLNSNFWDLVLRKVSVIVPCHGEHVLLLDSLLQNFNRFTRKPYEVIISVSMRPNQNEIETSNLLSKLRKFYPLNLKFHLSFQALTASQNRNLAAYQSRGDILVFLDADDQYHPQLIETIEHIWKIQNPIELHWTYIAPPQIFSEINLAECEIVSGEEVYYEHHKDVQYFNPKSWDGNYTKVNITNGHSAVTKQAWVTCPWPQIINGEDLLMHHKLSWKYKNRSIWLKNPLTLWQVNNSTGLDQNREILIRQDI